MKQFSCIALFLGLISCQITKRLDSDKNAPQIRFLSEYVLNTQPLFENTKVGGLSGIDYNEKNDTYYLISDDRSDFSPVRFYTAKIRLKQKSIDSVWITNVATLLQPDGTPYPPFKQNAGKTPDSESIRVDGESGNAIWTNEGERFITKKDTILANPSILISNLQGQAVGEYPIPSQLHMSKKNQGPRSNGTLEGLALTPTHLFAAMEEPLIQDGPKADLTENQAWVRILEYNRQTQQPTAQYAYALSPVAQPTIPADGFKVNGISEILALNEKELIVVERSYSTGQRENTIRIYEANLAEADNVQTLFSLKEKPNLKLIPKTLLFSLENTTFGADNVEGICWGPRLPNGNRSLVLVSDNNFSAQQKTQFLLLEWIEQSKNQ